MLRPRCEVGVCCRESIGVSSRELLRSMLGCRKGVWGFEWEDSFDTSRVRSGREEVGVRERECGTGGGLRCEVAWGFGE